MFSNFNSSPKSSVEAIGVIQRSKTFQHNKLTRSAYTAIDNEKAQRAFVFPLIGGALRGGNLHTTESSVPSQ